MIFIGKYPHDVRVRREAEALQEAGFEVHAICNQYPGQPKSETINGVQVHRLKIRRFRESKLGYIKTYFLFIFFAFFKMLSLHLRLKFDVIHVHNVPDTLILCALGAKLLGARVIFDMHEIMPEFFQRKYNVSADGVIIKILKLQEKFAARLSDAIITATPFLRETVVSRSSEASKVTTILNLTDPKYFSNQRATIRRNPNPFKLVYAGTYSKIHGVDLAIKAIKKIIDEKDYPIQLFLYGTGEEEKNLQELIKSLNLHNHVFLKNEVRIDQIAGILSQMDCGLVPKRDGVFIGEAISTKMFDYAAVGLPIICSKTSGDSLYFDETMAVFFEPDNIDQLASKILELYKNYELRLKLSENCFSFFQNMNWITEKVKLVNVYHQTLGLMLAGEKYS